MTLATSLIRPLKCTWQLFALTILQLVCRGIRCHQGDNQWNRLLITLKILRTLKEQLRQSSYTFQEKLMLWPAFTIAFYGFFRASEYVNLRWDDVTYDEEQMSITLHQSKTDPFRRGHTVHIFKTTSSTCPLKALKRYKDSVTSTPPNAFQYHAGRFTPLSRPAVTRVIGQLLSQAGLNYMDYASHSFRIGAAITAAAAGLPAWMIKSLGRWSSNAHLFLYSLPTIKNSSYSPIISSYGRIQPTRMGPRLYALTH